MTSDAREAWSKEPAVHVERLKTPNQRWAKRPTKGRFELSQAASSRDSWRRKDTSALKGFQDP